MKLTTERSPNTQLILFYDGFCPLCVGEMQHLARRDKQAALCFFDIHRPDLPEHHPDVDFFMANRVLHAKTTDGTLITGLDVTYQAWRLVGRGFLIAPLRWPIIRLLADRLYLEFAKHRYGISFLLTGQRRCDDTCLLPRSPTKREQHNEP